ncbi:MAG: hypothetical protein GQ574_25390 [Crocinitomix sp.]|nr:hypothetical protein [Crocinitomix sp.]
MKISLILLLLLPFLSFAHNIPNDGLWKGYTVKDTLGNEVRYKRQDFVKIKGDTLLLFQFRELMSMETGEVIIKTVTDTMFIDSEKSNGIYQLSHDQTILRLEVKDDNEFQIFYPKFILTFKRMNDIPEPKVSLGEAKTFVIGSTFIEIDPATKKVTGTMSKTYQDDGKAKYQETDSHRGWESAFKIVAFEGYIFLKGITSAPILICEFKDLELKGWEVDYRFDPEKVGLKKIKN